MNHVVHIESEIIYNKLSRIVPEQCSRNTKGVIGILCIILPPGKATESRGVGVGVGGIIIYCFRFNMNHVIHPIETPPRLLAGEGGVCFLKVQSLLLNSGSKSHVEMAYNR